MSGGTAGPVHAGPGGGRGGSAPPATTMVPSPLVVPCGRFARASDSGGAYGGVDAHEAAKLRSRDSQRKFRQRQKVRRCPKH